VARIVWSITGGSYTQVCNKAAPARSICRLGSIRPTRVHHRNDQRIHRRTARRIPCLTAASRSIARSLRNLLSSAFQIPPAATNSRACQTTLCRKRICKKPRSCECLPSSRIGHSRATDVTAHWECWMRAFATKERLRNLLPYGIIGFWNDLSDH
jgi:hypothetical protein